MKTFCRFLGPTIVILCFSGWLLAKPTITTSPTLPPAVVNSSYSTSLTATGGVSSLTWAQTGGTLPPGLSLSTTLGVISGVPTTAGNFSFTVQVSDSSGQSDPVTFSITVAGQLSITTPATLPNGAVGRAYSQTLAATGGTQPYFWSSTSIPPGLTLSEDGVISGVPASVATTTFTATVIDSSASQQSASRNFTITIQPQLTITTSTSPPLAVVGAFYSFLLEATGPTPINWSVISGIIPPGINLNQSGVLSGTPQVPGTFDFTVQASANNPTQTATRSLRVVVNDALRIITPAALPDATLAAPYTLSLEASGGLPPYTWTNPGRALPPGMTLSSDGVISGTPTGVGVFSFTLQLSDSFTPAQQVSRTFQLIVSTPVSITTTTLPNATQNVEYTQLLRSTGTPPFTWLVTAGTLPTGLTLSTGGLLQGTPVDVVTQVFTVTVTDSRGLTATREFTLVVDPPIPALSVPGLPTTLSTRQSQNISLTLASPHPSPLTGQLKLTFTSTAEIPSDDPMTQFSTGSRIASFTIPANETAAVFTSNLMLLTGTVAGSIRLTATFDNGPVDVAVTTANIPAAAPQITEVTAFRTGGGLNVQITGFAPSRRVSGVEFSFDVKNGNKTQRVSLARSVDSEFSDWYRNPSSTTFGSSFSFLQSFTIEGDVNAIEGVTVRLTNAQGTATSTTVKPQ